MYIQIYIYNVNIKIIVEKRFRLVKLSIWHNEFSSYVIWDSEQLKYYNNYKIYWFNMCCMCLNPSQLEIKQTSNF